MFRGQSSNQRKKEVVKMTKIKINDLPKDLTVDKNEMRSILGGIKLQRYPSPYKQSSFWTYQQTWTVTHTGQQSSEAYTTTLPLTDT